MNCKHLIISVVAFLLCLMASAQNHEVKGVVVDVAGEPVIGASVIEADSSSNGVVTELDGKFALNVRQGATLSVSCIGYVTKEIKVGTQIDITVVLEEDKELLD